MNNYTDYQNYVLNKIAYVDLKVDCKPGETLLECIPETGNYQSLRKEIEEAGLGHLTLKSYVNNNDRGSRTGFCAIAVEDPTTGAVGVSYRGTEDLDKITTENQIDMIDNIYTAVIGTSEQKREALKFFEENMNNNGENFLFGHSKGGELASEVYVEYYEEIKAMNLYNPQPINHVKLNKKQKEALQDNKVNVVIIDGDFVTRLGKISVFGDRISYMKCNAKKDGFVYPHQLEAASFNDDQSITIEEHPYEKYPDQKALGDVAETIIRGAQNGLLPRTTLLVLAVAKTYEFVVQDVPNMIEKFEKAIDSFLDTIQEAKDKIKELKAQVRQFIGNVKGAIASWYNKNFNYGYKQAVQNTYIKVDTNTLRYHANRLYNVNRRIANLDRRMDSLYTKVGLFDLWDLLQADALTGYSWRLSRCINYLNDTANEFDAAERSISSQV